MTRPGRWRCVLPARAAQVTRWAGIVPHIARTTMIQYPTGGIPSRSDQVTAERSGNAPRGRRNAGRGGGPQQRASGSGQGTGPRRVRRDDNSPRGQRPTGAGSGAGGRTRPRTATGSPRAGGPRPPGGPQRRSSGTAGWTAVRPWRPPRDDASEPLLDDDTQPDWTEQRPARSPGAPRPAAGAGGGRMRPPPWPGGPQRGTGRQGGRRSGAGPNRPNGSASNSGRGPAQRGSGPGRRTRTWLPPESQPDDD
jgi:hypothetical protein